MSSDHERLPTLPLEIHAHILASCDVQTLGRTSQASLAFLELSGPLLYQDIVIRGQPHLEQLIRSESVSPTLARFVSLSQARTLTYILLGDKAHDLPHRLVQSPALLDKVTVDCRSLSDWLPSPTNNHLNVFLSSFNPAHLHLLSGQHLLPQPDGETFRVTQYFQLPDTRLWTRLRTLTLTNMLPDPPLRQTTDLHHRDPLLEVNLDFGGPEMEDEEECADFVGDLGHELMSNGEEEEGQAVMKPAFGRVRVWLREEEVGFATWLFEAEEVGRNCTELEIGSKKVDPA